MNHLTDFVQEHINDDTSRLILNKGKWAGIDMELAVSCIESRRKLKSKVQEWYENPQLIFPLKLSAEQCSSTQTGLYKAILAQRIAASDTGNDATTPFRIADLTGGFGVDTWCYSKIAEKVLYCERMTILCEAAKHNFNVLGAENIEVRNCTIVAHSAQPATNEADMTAPEATVKTLLPDFKPDIVYIDPARRGQGGKKVFLIEECTPDVISLKREIFAECRHILIKLSPMADITMVCERLGTECREVHVVGAGGECKELLIWMDREWNEEYQIIAVELSSDMLTGNLTTEAITSPPKINSFRFKPSEEKHTAALIATKEDIDSASVIFEPGKALMKAGAFNTICSRYGLRKLGKSTHYYICTSKEEASPADMPATTELTGLGKSYRILRWATLDKRNMKSIAADFPKAEVTARNLPMDTDTLRKKLGTTSSDRFHIFGLKSDTSGNLLFATERQ